MQHWSFDILRQTTWDLWTIVCIFAALILAAYLLLQQPWRKPIDWLGLLLPGGGILGTLMVIAISPLQRASVGLVWTVLLLVMLSITFYRDLIGRLGTRRTGTLLALRIVAIVLLVPMLFEPVVRFVSQQTPVRPVVLLVDTSGSMSVPDVANGPTRIQSVWQALRPQIGRLSEHFVPMVYTFGTSATPLAKPADLSTAIADGKSTDLVGAIKTAVTQSKSDDAMYVLLSDGIDNTSANVVDLIAAMRKPINTVTVGSDQAETAQIANVSVDDLAASDDFVVGHETTIKATIHSTALADRVVDVNLAELGKNGQPNQKPTSQKLVLQSIPQGQTVELKYKPTAVGVHRLAVWIDPIPGERTTADNRQELQGLALDPRIKVLYVEGRARPEYGSLSRSLNRDPNIELATLLRVQQNRFAAGGSVDGTPFKQMPTSPAEWKKFDIILLGDLDASFLTTAQQASIERMVADGGALLMIGGQNTLGPGGYAGTPIEKALPVLVGSTDAPQEKSEFVPRLTSDGAAHPIMQDLSDWFGVEAKAPTKQLPPLLGNVVVSSAKAGAEVLAVHADRPGPDGKPQVVLAIERYGKGRSAVFTVDTTYRWYLPLRGMGQDSPYNRLWGQLIRWLAGEDVRNRQRGMGVEALLNKSAFQLGETVHVRAMVRDEKGDATKYAQVSVTVKSKGDDKPRELPMPPVDSHTGMYDATVSGLGNGDWSAEIVAKKDGKELGRKTVKFSVLPPADEMLKIAANPKLMASIASATQGYNCPLSGLNDLVDALIRSDPNAGATAERSVPLDNLVRVGLAMIGHATAWPKRYDFPMQGALIIALLLGEWILRRKWQLT